MTTLIEKSILNERLEKSRSGIYADTSENRRKHRVGQKYGSEKKEEEKPEKTSSNEKDPAKELEAVDKVIAAINEGKLKLPQEEIMVLIEKKNNLELAKRQAEKIHSGVKENEEKRNAAEVKETSKKINEVQKEDLREARKKLAYLQDNEERLIKRDGKEKYEERLKQAKDEVAKLKGEEPQEEAKSEPKKEEEKKRGYRLDDSAIIKDSNKTKAEKISEIKDKYAKLMKKHADELNRMGIPSGHQLALLQRTRDEKIKEIEAQEEPKKEESRGEKKTDKAADPIYQVQQKKKEASKKYDSKREEARQKYDKEADEIRSEIDKLYESDHPDAAKKRKELWNTLKEKTNKYDAETTRLKDEYEAEYKKLDEAEDKLYDQRQKEETSEEVKESYTRVKFEDVPNSGKVNLKKYLSEKVRQGVDEKWSNIKNIPTDNLKKMEKGLVNDLNKNFEAIKKSQRAELLYSIMKVKGELEKRGKESQKKE
jgi:hypothetical protein